MDSPSVLSKPRQIRGPVPATKRRLKCLALAAATMGVSNFSSWSFVSPVGNHRAYQTPCLLRAKRLSGQQNRTPRSASATTDASGADEGELPRRFVFFGGFLVVGAVASKKYLTDGNMDEFTLAPGSMKGRTIVITGGNTGLGLESAVRLAKGGASIVLTARSDRKGQSAVDEVQKASGSSDVHYLLLDLADLSSVNAFRAKFEAQPYGDHIDVLMNNAGVMAIPTRLETKDGFEQQIGTNHLGHFALVGGLLPLLKKAKAGARVVNVSSTAHLGASQADLDGDFMSPARYTQWGAYCASKLANVLFAKELDRRLKAANVNVTAVSCHPGAISTDLQRWLIADGDPQAARDKVKDNNLLQVFQQYATRPLNLGANTQVYLAAGADGNYSKSGGMYFDNMAPGLENPAANDKALASQLWEQSERLTGVKIQM